MNNRNKIWIISLVVTTIVLVSSVYFLPSKERTYINYLSIVGLILGILGLAISYLQILSVKQITLAIKNEVTESLNRNKSVLLISDISKKVSMIAEIQSFIRNNKIEMCVLRMKDLKLLLSDLNTYKQFSSLVNKKEFNSSYADFHIDLENFHKSLLNEKNKIDKEKINSNLEKLSTLLLDVEFKLKRQ
ncbi:hypothetical protein [Pedobacter sp. P26]|uniref:hypothetical protein n=1 Tax=Pedobacter sp. P26 TaxID=3423956 RepID=UPI003D6790AB